MFQKQHHELRIIKIDHDERAAYQKTARIKYLYTK